MTIKDIAKQCGVSVSTVSRVLNDHPDVSDSVREKVMAVVCASHYVPNNSARDLVRTQSDTIGVIIRGVNNFFFSDLLDTIAKEIDAYGMTMALRQIQSDADEIQAGALLEREKKLRGLIFLGGRFDYMPEELRPVGVPFVCCTYTNSFGTLEESEYASVSIDDQQAAYDAVMALISRGHVRIAALVPNRADRSVSELRYNGYRAALFASDLPYDKELVVETGGCFDMESAYSGVESLLDRGTPFTAIFSLSDTMAIAAIKALNDHGLRVPKDCSVIGIDGLRLSKFSIPTLTTMAQPVEEMGRESVSILMDMVRKRHGPRHTRLLATLREGDSVQTL